MMPGRDNGSLESVTTKAVRSAPAVVVEYPTEGEVLAGPRYTFRIGTIREITGVEVSIDKGEWMVCRQSLGIWWYDWSGYAEGKHVVLARTLTGENGTSVASAVSAPRRFTVA